MTDDFNAASDIETGGWLDQMTPAKWHPYFRLMRLDRPMPIWLLLLPGLWSISLSAGFWKGLWLFILFGIGSVIMRGAGCAINDIIDRNLDRNVARTANRPLASGEITLPQALLFVAGLLAAGFLVLLCLNGFTIYLGAASLLLVIPYPLMKRITFWPQAWLGLTFNWGALLGWAAVNGTLSLAPGLLYLGGVFWTLGYDTIYALQDKEDDAQVGIKSTALRFGGDVRWWVSRFYGATIALFALAGLVAGMHLLFFIGLLIAGGHLAWQVYRLKIDDPRDCLAKFRSNRLFGLILLAAILADRLL